MMDFDNVQFFAMIALGVLCAGGILHTAIKIYDVIIDNLDEIKTLNSEISDLRKANDDEFKMISKINDRLEELKHEC